jgi:uncharacterized FlaG/YvyC family protein
MNEFSITSVNKVDREIERPAAVKAVEQRAAVQDAEKSALPQKGSEDRVASKPNLMKDVFLRFQVKEDTHDVTVYVVDRTSKRVVRTIPPEELNNLNSGDLLELLA